MDMNLFSPEDIEDIILGMADIVMENRTLRRELEKVREYEKKYRKLLSDTLKESEETNKQLLKACLMGCFNVGGSTVDHIIDEGRGIIHEH